MSTYNSLLENGWKMNEIDEMDMIGYLHVRAWKAQEKRAAKTKPVFIDKVWPRLRP